jgi:hypothetical protein
MISDGAGQRGRPRVEETAMDGFTAALAGIVAMVVWVIVKAVRQTRGQIERHLRSTDPRRQDEIARELATRIRKQADEVRCVHCGGPTFMLLGTEDTYECESCHTTFKGPPHMPEPGP